jgi:hypothetical protein
MRVRINKKISLSIEEYDTLLYVVENQLNIMDAEIKNETHPTKKFELKMQRCIVEELLFKI